MDAIANLMERAGPVGAIIAALSVVGLFILLERFWIFRRLTLSRHPRVEPAVGMVRAGDAAGAHAALAADNHPLSRVLAALAASLRESPPPDREALNQRAHRAATDEIRRLSRFLPTLGLIAHVAPLLGLLGTVTGMIDAFRVIQDLGGKVNASVLAGGIWEAMLTTAMGLAVAIPAFIGHAVLHGRLERFGEDAAMEADALIQAATRAEKA